MGFWADIRLKSGFLRQMWWFIPYSPGLFLKVLFGMVFLDVSTCFGEGATVFGHYLLD